MRNLCSIILAMGVLVGCSIGGPADDATGEEIYDQLCARCHGADLSGGVGPPLGPGTNAAAETDDYLEFTVLNGRGRMPSFSSSLDEAQLDRLIAYIRTEQG